MDSALFIFNKASLISCLFLNENFSILFPSNCEIVVFIFSFLLFLIACFFLIGLVLNVRKKYKILKKDHELLDKEVQNLRRIPIQE